jgi:hypothetical protein
LSKKSITEPKEFKLKTESRPKRVRITEPERDTLFKARPMPTFYSNSSNKFQSKIPQRSESLGIQNKHKLLDSGRKSVGQPQNH